MTIHLAIEHVVFDAHDPGRLASFWSEILERPIADDWGEFVRLAPDGGGVRIAFAAVPEEKAVKPLPRKPAEIVMFAGSSNRRWLARAALSGVKAR